jgi:hypothetical protein
MEMRKQIFFTYGNCRKHANSVWKIEKDDGTWETHFTNMEVEGVKYFQSRFKDDYQDTIA